MATATRTKRTVAPKATTRTEAPVTPAPVKAHFFARAKTFIVKTAKRVVTFTKSVARKVATVASKATKRIQPIATRAWTVALRPFLKGVAAGVAFFMLLVSAFVSPVATIVGLWVAALAFLAAARGLQWLERNEHTSRFARITLSALNAIALTLRAAAYVFSAFVAIALCATSVPFAVFTALLLVLAYFDVRGAGTIAFLAWCLFSGSWALGLLWLLWRGASTAARDEVIAEEVPAYSEIRLKPVRHEDVLRAKRAMEATDAVLVPLGTEEVAHLVNEPAWDELFDNVIACEACGTTKGALRIRSNALPFATAGDKPGTEHPESDHMLCSSCYALECEDNAIAMTGVSLKKRSVQVTLTAVGRAALPEYQQSKTDITQVYWATVSWWRDRKNNHHVRQWDCFHDGKVVATVVYDHTRKVYRASALGKFLGTKTGELAAKSLATDAIFDEANAVDRMVEAFDGDQVPTSPQEAVQRGLTP